MFYWNKKLCFPPYYLLPQSIVIMFDKPFPSPFWKWCKFHCLTTTYSSTVLAIFFRTFENLLFSCNLPFSHSALHLNCISHITKCLCEREHFVGLSRADIYLKILRKYYKWKKVLITFRKLQFILIFTFNEGMCPTTSLSSSVLTYKANSQSIVGLRHFSDVPRLDKCWFNIQLVKTSTDQHQQILTGVTHWSDKTWQTCLLLFIGICRCNVNWPFNSSTARLV